MGGGGSWWGQRAGIRSGDAKVSYIVHEERVEEQGTYVNGVLGVVTALPVFHLFAR